MSKRPDYDAAKRRDQALAERRAQRAETRRARQGSSTLPSSPATDRQRTYLAKLHGQLGVALEAGALGQHQPLELAPSLTVGQASRRIAQAKVALTRARNAAPCAVCDARPGEPCVKRNGKPRTHFHDKRGTAHPSSTRGST